MIFNFVKMELFQRTNAVLPFVVPGQILPAVVTHLVHVITSEVIQLDPGGANETIKASASPLRGCRQGSPDWCPSTRTRPARTPSTF